MTQHVQRREWTVGCYKFGGTTECSGPALLYTDPPTEVKTREVLPDEITINLKELEAAWGKALETQKGTGDPYIRHLAIHLGLLPEGSQVGE